MARSKQRILPRHSIIMIGSGGVGKSALTLRFMYNEFSEEYDPTRADSYNKKVSVDGSECFIDILDTAGQEEYAAIRDNYIRSGEGFICVFSISERESFNAAIRLREQVCRALNRDDPPFVLVGNKVDLDASRQMAYQEGAQLAKQWGNCTYIEASAKTQLNVEEIFTAILRRVIYEKNNAFSAPSNTLPSPSQQQVPSTSSRQQEKKKTCNVLKKCIVM